MSELAPAASDPAAPAATVEESVRAIIATSLGRPLDEVHLDSALMNDLGAESLDLLDIVFCIEREFAIEITRGEMERVARGDMTDEEFAPGGLISEAGLARLRQLMPEAAHRIAAGLRAREILSLFTVQTFANMVHGKREGRQV
ncbi:MAG: acyl carrier protein [Deltaproteobacteria bacterium]|nr:acyl carrier protein [Deltaproteobacteria bacterium]